MFKGLEPSLLPRSQTVRKVRYYDVPMSETSDCREAIPL